MRISYRQELFTTFSKSDRHTASSFVIKYITHLPVKHCDSKRLKMALDPNQKEDDGDIDLVLDAAEGELIAMSGEDNEGDGPPTDPDMPDLIDDRMIPVLYTVPDYN